jgi:hypothetical protein
MITQQEIQTNERLSIMPKQYRENYKKAITGKSRKSAMRAFCVECCGWEIGEVFLCTDKGCSLYPYRPRSRVSQGTPESIPEPLESKNQGK